MNMDPTAKEHPPVPFNSRTSKNLNKNGIYGKDPSFLSPVDLC